MGNSAHDGNLTVQQNGLLPRNSEPVDRQNCFSLQWSMSLALLPTSLCNNLSGDGGGTTTTTTTTSSSSSSSSSKGDDSNNSSLQFLRPFAD